MAGLDNHDAVNLDDMLTDIYAERISELLSNVEPPIYVSQGIRLVTGSLSRVPTEVGTIEHQEYQPVYDRKGVWHLEETKKSNRYMEIQSHADSCDLNIIMQRYQRGELNVLEQVQGYYGDVSNIPSNYADILNETIRGEAIFRSLAPEIRSQFGNSAEQFVSALGDGSAWEILNVKPSEPSVPADNKEVSDNES